MDIVWLQDLIALATHESFSRAAEARNITQPAYGRRIRALEDWVGVPLVDRSTHRIKLTTSGDVMLRMAHEVLQRIETARRDAIDSMSTGTTLRFASTHALSMTFFPAMFKRITATTEPFPVHLFADNMSACENMILDGRVHFILCHQHSEDQTKLKQEDFSWIELGSDLLIPIAKRDEGGAPLFRIPGSLDKPAPTLGYDNRSGLGRIISGVFGESIPATRRVFTSHLAVALKNLAADGHGIAWTPLSLIEEDLGSGGRLARAGENEWEIPIRIVLGRPKRNLGELVERFWSVANTTFPRTG